ncbi:MAG: hypothetical protein WA921_02670 [Ahrensia sp.]
MPYHPIALVYFAMTLGICVLGILFFWKMRSRGKPVLAWTLWVLAFGYSVTQLWRTIVFAYVAPGVITVLVGALSVMILSAYVAAVFYSPLPRYQRDDDGDDDTPFTLPDEV